MKRFEYGQTVLIKKNAHELAHPAVFSREMVKYEGMKAKIFYCYKMSPYYQLIMTDNLESTTKDETDEISRFMWREDWLEDLYRVTEDDLMRLIK